ncbi:MAG: hypothetical protein ABJB66_13975 [Gemmatimonadaceae bacterium]
MITVGLPWLLGASVASALVTTALHFLSVRKPQVILLPTMRFLPDRPRRAVSRTAKPSDLWLLLLRVCALLLVGIALSGITWRARTFTHGRVVVVDRNVDSGDLGTLRTRAGSLLHARMLGDTATRFVVMDSTARPLSVRQMRAFHADTINALNGHTKLSSMILAGTRGASALVREESNIDSVELVILAPIDRAMTDAALPAARALWPGNIRLIDLASEEYSSDTVTPKISMTGAPASSAVLSALTEFGAVRVDTGSTVTVSAAVIPGSVPALTTVIEWPESGVPDGWSKVKPDTIGAIVARGRALVWPFVRSARIPDSLSQRGRAIAWWSDGVVAAIETRTANSCVRHVGITVTNASDVMQGRGARALLSAVAARCDVRVVTPVMTDEVRDRLEGTRRAAPASAFTVPNSAHTPYASLLLLIALLLLAVEWWARDRERMSMHLRAERDTQQRNAA